MSLNKPSPDKTAGPQTTPAQQHVFTFVTVYYKHGEWDSEVYDTLRGGLLDSVNDLVERESLTASEGEDLVLLDDEKLVDKLLKIGMRTVYMAGKHY